MDGSGSYLQPCVEGESQVSPAVALRGSVNKSHIVSEPLDHRVYKHMISSP